MFMGIILKCMLCQKCTIVAFNCTVIVLVSIISFIYRIFLIFMFFTVLLFFLEPINTFHTMVESDNEPIRLSYHRGSHYNSIVDPYKATIGVGLGLPSYNPGAADHALISDAVRQSEELHIEQVIIMDL